MLTLFTSSGACSLVPHVALEASGEEYSIEHVLISKGENRQPAYLRVNPRGLLPTLRLEDGSFVTENIGILSYIAAQYPSASVFPGSSAYERATTFSQLSYYASAVHVAFAQIWRPERFVEDEANYAIIRNGGRLSLLRHFDVIEASLHLDAFALGSLFCACDTYLLTFYRWAVRIGNDSLGVTMKHYPNWTRHTERVMKHPPVARVMTSEGIVLK